MIFASAALAWYEGMLLKAGTLLESHLMDNPHDVLMMRIAQDCYLAAGSSENVLGCITRYPEAFDGNSHLQGCVLGMLSAGYLEIGRLPEAEEYGSKAVELTKVGKG